jgi:hypothetical protein
MVVSVQIAELSARAGLAVLAKPPRPRDVPGLRYAERSSRRRSAEACYPHPTSTRWR